MSRSVSSRFTVAALLLVAGLLVRPSFSQEPPGPQTSAPPPVPPRPAAPPKNAGPVEHITIPSGTRVAVVLENGISTRSAKAGDSIYLRTSFPITQNNHVVVPVGSYLRGELLESKRPGRIKGRGEFRMKLDTLIFPTGYTVDLNAAPRSADSGGKETMDSEGKITGPGGKDIRCRHRSDDHGRRCWNWCDCRGSEGRGYRCRNRRPGGAWRRIADPRSGCATPPRLSLGYCLGGRFVARQRPDSVHQRG